MNIDEGLAQRVRESLLELADFADISERKMFGALMTMVNGHMTDIPAEADTVRNSGLLLRVGASRYDEALQDPHCRPMDFSGKTMTGFVYIDSPGLQEDADLRRWLELSLSFVLAQPPK